MIGFRIALKNESFEVTAEATHVIFSMVKTENREEINLDICGSNYFMEEYLNWGSWKLEKGDEIRISVVDVKNITEPKIKEIETTSEDQLKEELATYLSLKQELENAMLL